MKQFNVNENGGAASGGGWGGMLLRTAGFVALLTGALILLNLIGPDEHDRMKEEYEDPELIDVDSIVTDPIVLHPEDTLFDETEWKRTPPVGPEFPDSNVIRMPDPEDIVENPEDKRRYVANKLNVIVEKRNENTLRDFGRRFKQEYPGNEYRILVADENTCMLQIAVPADEHEKMKEEMPERLSDFSFIVFDEEIWESLRQPSDPKFSNEACRWYFEPIQAYEAWDITMGSPDVTVAVLDGFFDLNHPEFQGKVVRPFNVVRQSRNLAPFPGVNYGDASHGSNVAGLAVANVNNGTGLCGIAPKCKMMPVGVFYDVLVPAENGPTIVTGSFLTAYGLLYAIYNGADVINLSLGVPSPLTKLPPQDQLEIIKNMPKDLEKVWDYIYTIAERRNVVIVHAAGNDHALGGFDSSKRNRTTIRVSAVGPDLQPTNFTNFGYEVEGKNDARDFSSVSAPGFGMYAPGHGGRFTVMNGTSQAAPVVAGAVALMKSVNPDITATEIIEILQETGKPVGHGCGPLIQIRDALKRVSKREEMRFDDIKRNPESMVGLWKSTTGLENTRTKAQIVYYYRFTSSTQGELLVKDSGDGTTYEAPITVSISNDQVRFTTTANPVNDRGDKYQNLDVIGRRGESGVLECSGVNVESQIKLSFRLQRVRE